MPDRCRRESVPGYRSLPVFPTSESDVPTGRTLLRRSIETGRRAARGNRTPVPHTTGKFAFIMKLKGGVTQRFFFAFSAAGVREGLSPGFLRSNYIRPGRGGWFGLRRKALGIHAENGSRIVTVTAVWMEIARARRRLARPQAEPAAPPTQLKRTCKFSLIMHLKGG